MGILNAIIIYPGKNLINGSFIIVNIIHIKRALEKELPGTFDGKKTGRAAVEEFQKHEL